MFSMMDGTGRVFVFESVDNVYIKVQDAPNKFQFIINLLADTNFQRIV